MGFKIELSFIFQILTRVLMIFIPSFFLAFFRKINPSQNCRLYYSQISMEPQHAIASNKSNTNRKVIYRTFVTNNYPPVAALGSFNQLINSGIVHPTGVLIVPFLVPVTGTSGGLKLSMEIAI